MSEIGGENSTAPRVVLAVVTYKRPSELGRLLPLLVTQAWNAKDAGSAEYVEVLVVDNDPEMTAKAVVRDLGAEIAYIPEPAAGVAAARNRVLQSCGGRDVLVFIDDDETPAQDDWLIRLLDARERFSANVVAGPVRTVFEGDADEWVLAGRFFARDHRVGMKTGAPIAQAATNNLLVDLAFVEDLDLRFDDAFGRSGGEDSLFTAKLNRAGARMVWCAEAEVLDHLPLARRTREHALRRTRSMAASGVRVDLALSQSRAESSYVRGRSLAVGALRFALGTCRVIGGSLRKSMFLDASGRRGQARGVGEIAGALGREYVDYGPPESSGGNQGAGQKAKKNKGSRHG